MSWVLQSKVIPTDNDSTSNNTTIMSTYDLFMQRLAEHFSFTNIVLVTDNARSPATSVTRTKQLRSLRRPRRWNSTDGLTKVVSSTSNTGNMKRRCGHKHEHTYPPCRWEPACKDDNKLPPTCPMSLRGLSKASAAGSSTAHTHRQFMAEDLVMKLPTRCPDSPNRNTSDGQRAMAMLNDVLDELNVLDNSTK